MNNIFRLTIALVAIFCLGGEAHAQDAETGKPAVAIDISADHMERDGETDVIRAWGHVVVRFEDRVLEADKVRIHRKTGIGEAKGHVVLTQTDGTVLTAQRTRFNMKNKQGQVFDVVGKIEKKYYITGKEVTRIPPNRYLLTDASLTTCRGPVPDWKFEANTIDVVKDDRALFTHGVFKVRDIPILYVPVGYIPINRNRKSGLLLPSIGYSNTDGFTFGNAYYWAINRSYDATVTVDYLGKRGVRPGLELRYAPSKNTAGEISGNYLDDNETGSEFWKVDATHKQDLPLDFKFNGKLDLESDSSFNKTFEDNVNKRSRRSSDSFGYIHRSWADTTVDILARYRDSSEENRDDTFAHLPDATFSSLQQPIAGGPFYFNQDSNYTFFHLDLNPDPATDDNYDIHRMDFHPQLSLPMKISPWLSFTPTVGIRGTFYSDGLDAANNSTDSFSRESFDIRAAFEGPKINRVFSTGQGQAPKVKHVIEPRFSYDYIPDIDEDDRDKIKVLDATDAVDPLSRISYSLTQRLLLKRRSGNNEFETHEVLRFEISQSYDLREATGSVPQGGSREPFSDIRFDLDSRLMDSLLLNIDSTYDVHDDVFNTLNFEVGVKPFNSLTLFAERRFIRNDSTFITGTLDWAFQKSWRFQASTRYDEHRQTFRENNLSLLYDNPCRCWGLGFDYINREIIANGQRENENKFILNLTLRGLGSVRSRDDQQLLHRSF